MTDAPAVPPAVPGATTLGTTGRFLVLMREGQSAQGATLLKQAAGLRVASTADFSGQPTAEELSGSDGLLLHQLGVAVVSSPPDAITSLAASETSGVLAVEPERVVQSVALESEHAVYLRGYRDAVNHLYDALAAASAESVAKEALEASLAEVDATWGLQVTKVLASSFAARAYGSPFSTPGSTSAIPISPDGPSSRAPSSQGSRSRISRGTAPIASAPRADPGGRGRRRGTASPMTPRSTPARCCPTRAAAGTAAFWPASTGP